MELIKNKQWVHRIMVSILNLLKSIYMYILIFLGIFILGYAILSSDEANKNNIGKILGCLMIIIGCISMYLKS